MKEFIGREKELSLLANAYENNSNLVLVTGRRRIGKTRLLKEFLKDKESIYYLATNLIESEMFNDFWETVSNKMNISWGEPKNWKELFSAICSDGKRKVLVIDEFSYMVKMDKGFLIKFQGIYDEILKESNVLTILCGSHKSIMDEMCLREKSPLYGRFDRRIILLPLKFSSLKKTKSITKDIEEYAIHGGIPRYMELLNAKSIKENVIQNIMEPSSIMFEDPLTLLESEVGGSNVYLSIIRAIATGSHKSSEISSTLQIPSGVLSQYFSKLIESGYIKKDVPVIENNIELSKKSTYSLSDNFTSFWFRFIYPHKSTLVYDNTYAIKKFETDFVQRHVSFVFEEICRDALKNNPEKLTFIPEKIGKYWNKNVEIDIMAINNEKKIVFVGECKYKSKPINVHTLNELKKKVKQIPEIEGYEIKYGLFSISGFDKKLNEENVILFSAEDLR